MRRWWLKLVFGLAVVALLAFAGVKLYGVMMGLLRVVTSDGGADLPYSEEVVPEAEAVWTPPPYLADDSAYDRVTAVREYDDSDETPLPTEEP